MLTGLIFPAHMATLKLVQTKGRKGGGQEKKYDLLIWVVVSRQRRWLGDIADWSKIDLANSSLQLKATDILRF